MFNDGLMRKELVTLGYSRRTKFTYQASWGTKQVEHFVYLGKDSRQYLVGRFGLRNPRAEAFGVESLIKYGHPNHRTTLQQYDPKTACSINFEFGRLDNFSQKLWPRFRTTDVSGSDLAILVSKFIGENIIPVVKHLVTLSAFLNFLVADQEPTPWFVTNPLVRAAQVVATARQLGLGERKILAFLTSQERLISANLVDTQHHTDAAEKLVEQLVSDWERMVSA